MNDIQIFHLNYRKKKPALISTKSSNLTNKDSLDSQTGVDGKLEASEVNNGMLTGLEIKSLICHGSNHNFRQATTNSHYI